MRPYAKIYRLGVLLGPLAFLSLAAQAGGLGDLQAAWAKYDAARGTDDAAARVDAAREVLDVGMEVLPAGDERLPVLRLNYAQALNVAGEPVDARKTAEDALSAAEKLHGRDSIELLDYWITLGDIHGSLRSESLQSRAYRKALKLVSAHHGEDSEAYGDLAMDSGFKLFMANRSKKSSKLFREAAMAYGASLGETSQKTVSAGLALGRVEFQLGNYAAAEKELLDGLPALTAGGAELAESEMKVRALLVQLLERQGKSEEATEHCVAIGRLFRDTDDAGFSPLYREAPRYPLLMLQSRTQGHVDVAFTVDERGFVRDAVVVDAVKNRPRGRNKVAGNATGADGAAAGSDAFEEAALKAVQNFRYAPRVVDGQPMATAGVKTRITFRIE